PQLERLRVALVAGLPSRLLDLPRGLSELAAPEALPRLLQGAVISRLNSEHFLNGPDAADRQGGQPGLRPRRVPEPDGAVVTPREAKTPATAEPHRVHCAGVPYESVQASAAGRVPEPNGAVGTPRESESAVNAQAHRVHRARMPLKGLQTSAVGDIPKP